MFKTILTLAALVAFVFVFVRGVAFITHIGTTPEREANAMLKNFDQAAGPAHAATATPHSPSSEWHSPY